jgi:hypothetical protein
MSPLVTFSTPGVGVLMAFPPETLHVPPNGVPPDQRSWGVPWESGPVVSVLVNVVSSVKESYAIGVGSQV